MSTHATHLPPDLAGAAWLTARETQAVMAAIEAGGHRIRVVGGAVRNALLGRLVTDVDMATSALPDEVIALAAAAGLHAVPTGIDHGTVTVVAEHVPFEVTTLRTDVETHGRHATVAFTTDWAADARRRDFTVNALYCDAQGAVFDPLAGYRDLQAKRIVFIGDARQRVREDYLRILRFFRFNAEYAEGAPDAAGLAACVLERDGLSRLSGERIRQEVVRLLVAPRALAAVDAMISHGLLSPLLGRAPRPTLLSRLCEIERTNGLTGDAMSRLAALAVEVPEDADWLANRLRLSGEERAALLLGCRGPFASSPPIEAAQREQLYRHGTPAYLFTTLLDFAHTFAAGIADPAWTAALSLPDRWQPPAFPLRGSDVLAAGIAPGPLVGEILRTIETWWIASNFTPTDRDCRDKLAEIVTRTDHRHRN